MCLAMNADVLQPGERCASTSNRNFEGRRGPEDGPIWCRRPWPWRPPSKDILSIFGSGHKREGRSILGPSPLMTAAGRYAAQRTYHACIHHTHRPGRSLGPGRCRYRSNHSQAVLKTIKRTGYGRVVLRLAEEERWIAGS